MAVNKSQDLIQLPAIDITGPVTIAQPVTVNGAVSMRGLSIAGLITYVTIDNTAWFALPPVAQANRNSVAIQNLATDPILLNYSPSAPVLEGWTIYSNGEFSIDVTNSIPIYARAIGGSPVTLVIMELS